jgi:hypothetical protein
VKIGSNLLLCGLAIFLTSGVECVRASSSTRPPLPGSPRSGFALDEDSFDPQPGLASCARKLFPESAGATPAVTRVQTLDRFLDGFRYEVYEVRGSSGSVVGRLVRMQVFPDRQSTVDLVLKTDKDQLVAIEPLRPVTLGGRPFPRLPELMATLRGKPVTRLAGGLATFFGAVGRMQEGLKPPPPPPSPAPGTKPLVELSQPGLKLGAPLPPFSVKDRSGKAISNKTLAKQLVVFVFASMTEGISLDMLPAVVRTVDGFPDVRLVPVLGNLEADVFRFTPELHDAERILPRCVMDPHGGIRNSFQIVHLPWIYIFSKEGKLVFSSIWKGVVSFSSDLTPLVSAGGKR